MAELNDPRIGWGSLMALPGKLKRSETHNPAASASNTKAGLTLIGRAIAKFKEDDHLDDCLSDIYPRLGTRKSTSQRIDDEAFRAGHQAGREMTLNKPLTSQMGNQGKLLAQAKRP